MILVSCPHCGKRFNIKDRYAGKRGSCKNCGRILTVPKQPEESEARGSGTGPSFATPPKSDHSSTSSDFSSSAASGGVKAPRKEDDSELVLLNRSRILILALIGVVIVAGFVVTKVLPATGKRSGMGEMATLDEFERVKRGMSYASVRRIVGGRGEVVHRSRENDKRSVSKAEGSVLVRWKGFGENDAKMYGTFENDKLLAKSMWHLK